MAKRDRKAASCVTSNGGLPNEHFAHTHGESPMKDQRHLALGAFAAGATAVGAAALGALAVGALAIGKLAVRKARIDRLEINELVVRRLTVLERSDPDAGESA
jgi:hypothetical protein